MTDMTESHTVAFPQSRTCPYHPPTAYDPCATRARWPA